MIARSPRKVNQEFGRYVKKNVRSKKQISGKSRKAADSNFGNGETDPVEREPIKWNDVLNDYLESASVHGVQYFGKLSIKVGSIGKFIWACTMIAACICAALMVMQFLERFRENPVNTYIASFHAPIYLVPFPAVTICPYKSSSERSRVQLLSRLQLPDNMTKDEAMVFLRYGYDLTKPEVTERHQYQDKYEALLEANRISLADFLVLIRSCGDVFKTCWWNGKKVSCAQIFQVSHSSKGICCSFNYVLEDYIGLQEDEEEPDILHNDQYGPNSGLKVLFKEEMLRPDDDTYKLNNLVTSNIGIMVLLHNSLDYPGNEHPARVIQANREVQLSVWPALFRKPAGMYHENRQGHVGPLCVSGRENGLKYFPKYRYSNCYASCAIEATLKTCGCVPYSYEPFVRYTEFNPCGLDELVCLQENSKSLRIIKDTLTDNFTCFCTQPCDNFLYDTTPVEFSIQPERYELTSFKNLKEGQAVLRVYMGSQAFKVFQTLPVADTIYLLASTGGIFSLFLGCSFLSSVEIVYFVGQLIRAIWSRQREEKPVQKKRPAYDNQFRKAKPFLY